MRMQDIDDSERETLTDYEEGTLTSIATKGELAKLEAAARATAIEDRRIYSDLSSGDLSDTQVDQTPRA